MSFFCGCVHGHVQNLNDQFLGCVPFFFIGHFGL
jgi:hypothetical protein